MQLRIPVLLITSLFPSALLAATLNGTMESVVPPYLLVKTASGHEAVRLLEGGAVGGTDSLGHLKPGRDRVEVEWTDERNRVKIAATITRLPSFTVYPALEVPLEQAATWHESGAVPDRRQLVDVRPTSEWEEGHVPGAPSAPFNPISYDPCKDNRERKIILYGGSAQSNLAQRAAQRAISTGCQSIRVFSGGADEWAAKGKPLSITAAGAKRRLERGETLLVVDIRDEAAWLAGHIPASVTIPSSFFSPRALEVRNLNQPHPVLLVGNSEAESRSLFSRDSWGRSYNATVYLLEGGFDAWSAAGFPVASGEETRSAADLLPPGEIGPAEFRASWHGTGAAGSPLVLNLRDSDENAPAGHKTIPFEELEFRMTELPVDREIVIYCYTGTRAKIGYHMLRNNGYRVRYYNRTVRTDSTGNLLD